MVGLIACVVSNKYHLVLLARKSFCNGSTPKRRRGLSAAPTCEPIEANAPHAGGAKNVDFRMSSTSALSVGGCISLFGRMPRRSLSSPLMVIIYSYIDVNAVGDSAPPTVTLL